MSPCCLDEWRLVVAEVGGVTEVAGDTEVGGGAWSSPVRQRRGTLASGTATPAAPSTRRGT